MNAQTPVAKAGPLPRRVKKISDEIVRLTKRPQGATIEELCALSGMKEQTARSRLSKLKKSGYEIYRGPDGRYHFVPPGRKADYVSAAEPVEDVVEARVEPEPVHVSPSRTTSLGFDRGGRLTDDGLRNLLEIIVTHRELHLVGFQGGVVVMWDDHGKQSLRKIDVDIHRLLGAA